MSYDMIALGRRAVACKEWRWMSGMLMILDPSLPWDQRRVMRYSEDVRVAIGDDRFSARAWADGTAPVCELGDPATLGWMLWLVRRAWGHRTIHVRYSADVWTVVLGLSVIGRGANEAEALVAALEKAP